IAIRYGPNTNAAVSGASFSRGSGIKLFDVKNGTEIRAIGTNEPIADFAFSNDGKSIATIGEMGGAISLWDIQSGSKLRDFTTSPAKTMNDIFSAAQTGR